MTNETLNKVLNKTKEFLRERDAQEFIKKRHLTDDFLRLTKAGYINKDLADATFKVETQAELALTNLGKFRYPGHLIFPCFTFDESFCGFIGRATFETDYKFHLPEHILFNKDTYIHGFYETENADSKVCFVSENMFEWGRLLECGVTAVSLNGAYNSKFKMAVLANRFDKLVIVADNDQAGFGLKSFIKEYLADLNREVAFVQHNEKGLDEFYVKYGLEATRQLLFKYV